MLHREGGVLRGVIVITQGRGLAGWLGKRLSRKLGIPLDNPECGFEVTIQHSDTALYWNRRFAGGSEMVSVFYPMGVWPDGCWIEHIGFMRMRLTVDVIDGGWYWRMLGISIGGLTIPGWLFPRTRAYKRIEHDKYSFFVGFELPVLGTLLSYSGQLDACF